MTTVGAKVRVTGTSASATAALNSTTAAAGRLNVGLGKVAGVALATGAGVLGFGAATESARRIVQLASDSIGKYADANEDAAARLAGTRGELDKLQASIGGAIIGGGNLEQITGSLNIALQGLTAIVADNSAATQALALGGLRLVVNAGFDLAQGFTRLIAVGQVFKSLLLITGDALAIAAAGVASLAFQFDGMLSAALARVVEQAGAAADTLLAFGAENLPGIGAALVGVSAEAARFSDHLDDSAAAARANADEMRLAGAAARDGMGAHIADLSDRLLDLGATEAQIAAVQLEFNEALDTGAAAMSSYAAATGEAGAALTAFDAIAAARGALVTAEADALAHLTEKREAQKDHLAGLIKDEIDLRLHLDAIKAQAHDDETRRREAEQAATLAAVDGSLAGFGRLAEGNDKLSKALNVAAGARLAGQAIFQLNTGIGYALSGAYASGVALIAQSAISFAEAAKLGFGGGKKGGGSRQSVTTVNQTNVFAGGVDSATAPGFVEQLQAATRAGALEGAR